MDDTNSTAAENKGKKIVIDIARSDTACVMDDSIGFMQADAFKRVQVLAAETCGRLGSFREKVRNGACDVNSINIYDRFHDTIFVDGERGAGKTSFLLTAIDKLCDKKFDNEENKNTPQEVLKNIKFCSLGVIDPTLITSKNNLFILVIARIKDVVEKIKRERQVACDSDDKYRDWNESLKKLSRGLCMLDQVGGKPLEKEDWADAQYVLFKGLDDATGGLVLERAFHKFVYKSLEFIGKDSFVLGFDDVDTDFAKGHEIMEVLRKYITTPQIIVLMTANYSLLYEMAIQKFWDSFQNKNFIEIRGKNVLNCQVESVVSQYLKKIFKPERRIALNVPFELKNFLYIKIGNGDDVKFVNFFQAVIAIWFRLPYGVCRYIGEFFFKLPTRSLVMLISALQKKGELYVVMISLAANFQKGKSTSECDNLLKKHDVFDDNNFFDVFSQILYVYQEELLSIGYGIDDLRNMFDKFKMYKVGKHLFNKKLLGTCAALMPKDVSRVSDGDVFSLYQLVYGGFVAEIKNVFEYMVRILMLRDMVALVGYKSSEIKNLVSNYYNEQSSPFDLCDNFVKILLSKRGIDNKFFIKVKKLSDKELMSNIYNFICFRFSDETKIENGSMGGDTTKNEAAESGDAKSGDAAQADKGAKSDPPTYFSVYHYFVFLLFCCETSGDIVYALEQYSSLRTFSKRRVSKDKDEFEVDVMNEYASAYGMTKMDKDNPFSNLSDFIGTYSNPNDKETPCRWAISCPPYVLFNAYAKLSDALAHTFNINNEYDFKTTFMDVSGSFNSCLACEEDHYCEISAKLWNGEQGKSPKKYTHLHHFLNKICCLIDSILGSNNSKCAKGKKVCTENSICSKKTKPLA